MREGWTQTELGQVIDLLTGNAFKSDEYSAEDDGIRLLRGDNVAQGYVRWDDAKKWAKDKCSGLERYALQEHDIVVALDRTWVKSGLKVSRITKPDLPCLLVQRVARLRALDGLDQRYLDILVQSHRFSEMAKTAKTETAVPHISPHDVRDFIVALPPLSEQRKIAAILQTWGEAIEKLSTLRKAKAARHSALTHSLVFGTRQLAQFRTDDDPVAYRWFALPAKWACKPIGKLAKEVSERNADGDEHEVLSCSKYDGFVRSLEYFKKQVFSADLSGYKQIWRGDFGFPSNHIEEGSIGLQNLIDMGLVSPIYTVFRFAAGKVDPNYAYAVLKTELYRHIFEVSTSSSVDRRGSLRWREFSALPFPVPPLDEQKAIAAVLETSRRELDVHDREIVALTRQKRGLMQKLLTGEWPVRPDLEPDHD